MTNNAEANWSGSILFAKTGHAVFSKRRVKMLSGMANSEDPDQTAPSVWSRSALFAYGILWETLVFEILEHLP